ncbi:hypothetical protein LAZ67_11000003 [Cordylochernes scorpioides]|uniref:C2H2-type domain-containing protein n=1 Tax=Cordylochernes scorpioides TaxID=51811 RepID=A0ABY6L0B3_9ARAC|nr:hypothetical protein LAZ67_11000003 [Cordylochernes scorpioides]
MKYKRCSSCIPGLGALTGYYQPAQLSPGFFNELAKMKEAPDIWNDNSQPEVHSSEPQDKVSPAGSEKVCPFCEYRTSHSFHYSRHKRTHTGEKPFACTYCDYRTGDTSSLSRHKRLHVGRSHLPALTDREHLLSVQTQADPHGGEAFACPDCDYKTADSKDLSRHKRIHTGGEAIWPALTVTTRTADSKDLSRHKRIHTGEKPYACPYCDYRTGDTSALVTHKRTHTGEKPFLCPQCSYRTGDTSTLTAHIRIHTREKP